MNVHLLHVIIYTIPYIKFSQDMSKDSEYIYIYIYIYIYAYVNADFALK